MVFLCKLEISFFDCAQVRFSVYVQKDVRVLCDGILNCDRPEREVVEMGFGGGGGEEAEGCTAVHFQ